MNSLQQSPTWQVRCEAFLNLHSLKKVLHANNMAGETRVQFDHDLFELWGPEAYRRIAGEAEAFTRDAQERIQTLVIVLVMKQRQRVLARSKAGEPNDSNFRWNSLAKSSGVSPAIGKVGRISSHAGMNHAFDAAQLLHIDDQFGGRHLRCGEQRCGGEGKKAVHCGRRYRQVLVAAIEISSI